jgi:hypothetical protein
MAYLDEGLFHCPLRSPSGKVILLVGHACGRVPQHVRHDLLRMSLHRHMRRRRIAKVMEMEVFKVF